MSTSFNIVSISYLVAMRTTYGSLDTQFYVLIIILMCLYTTLCMIASKNIRELILLRATNQQQTNTLKQILQVMSEDVIVQEKQNKRNIVFCNASMEPDPNTHYTTIDTDIDNKTQFFTLKDFENLDTLNFEKLCTLSEQKYTLKQLLQHQ